MTQQKQNFKKERESYAATKFRWAQNSLYRVRRMFTKEEEVELAYMTHEIDQYRGWMENHYLMDKVKEFEKYAEQLLQKYSPTRIDDGGNHKFKSKKAVAV